MRGLQRIQRGEAGGVVLVIAAICLPLFVFLFLGLVVDVSSVKYYRVILSEELEGLCQQVAAELPVQRNAIGRFNSAVTALQSTENRFEERLTFARLFIPSHGQDLTSLRRPGEDPSTNGEVDLELYTSGGPNDQACNLNGEGGSHCLFRGDPLNIPNAPGTNTPVYPTSLFHAPTTYTMAQGYNEVGRSVGNTIGCELHAEIKTVLSGTHTIQAKTVKRLRMRGINREIASASKSLAPMLSIFVSPHLTTSSADDRFLFPAQGTVPSANYDDAFFSRLDPFQQTPSAFSQPSPLLPLGVVTYQSQGPDGYSSFLPSGYDPNVDELDDLQFVLGQPGLTAAEANEMRVSCANPVSTLRNGIVAALVEYLKRNGDTVNKTEMLVLGTRNQDQMVTSGANPQVARPDTSGNPVVVEPNNPVLVKGVRVQQFLSEGTTGTVSYQVSPDSKFGFSYFQTPFVSNFFGNANMPGYINPLTWLPVVDRSAVVKTVSGSSFRVPLAGVGWKNQHNSSYSWESPSYQGRYPLEELICGNGPTSPGSSKLPWGTSHAASDAFDWDTCADRVMERGMSIAAPATKKLTYMRTLDGAGTIPFKDGTTAADLDRRRQFVTDYYLTEAMKKRYYAVASSQLRMCEHLYGGTQNGTQNTLEVYGLHGLNNKPLKKYPSGATELSIDSDQFYRRYSYRLSPYQEMQQDAEHDLHPSGTEYHSTPAWHGAMSFADPMNPNVPGDDESEFLPMMNYFRTPTEVFLMLGSVQSCPYQMGLPPQFPLHQELFDTSSPVGAAYGTWDDYFAEFLSPLFQIFSRLDCGGVDAQTGAGVGPGEWWINSCRIKSGSAFSLPVGVEESDCRFDGDPTHESCARGYLAYTDSLGYALSLQDRLDPTSPSFRADLLTVVRGSGTCVKPAVASGGVVDPYSDPNEAGHHPDLGPDIVGALHYLNRVPSALHTSPQSEYPGSLNDYSGPHAFPAIRNPGFVYREVPNRVWNYFPTVVEEENSALYPVKPTTALFVLHRRLQGAVGGADGTGGTGEVQVIRDQVNTFLQATDLNVGGEQRRLLVVYLPTTARDASAQAVANLRYAFGADGSGLATSTRPWASFVLVLSPWNAQNASDYTALALDGDYSAVFRHYWLDLLQPGPRNFQHIVDSMYDHLLTYRTTIY